MFLNSKKSFQEHGIRVFHEKGLGSFQTFLIIQIWDKPDVLKTFQKQFWRPNIKPKKLRILWFRKIPCGLFPKPLKKYIFSGSGIFIEDYLRNLTCWEKSKNRFGRTNIKQESFIFFSAQKFVEQCFQLKKRLSAKTQWKTKEFLSLQQHFWLIKTL
jgi:hypothetical protein